MSFVVDDADWAFTGLTTKAILTHVEDRLAFIAVSAKRGENVWIGDEFQTRPVRDGHSVWQMLGDFPGEIRQEMAAWLGHARYYTDMPIWPADADETIIAVNGGEPEDSADISWVHHHLRGGTAMACLSSRYAGKLLTQIGQGVVAIHFIADEAGRIAFWRDAIRSTGDNAASLQRYASHAYPNIFFVPGVLANVDRFAGGYLALRAEVQEALSALDEHGVWLFTEAPPAVSPDEPRIGTVPAPTNKIIEDRFHNLGLDGAPEKPNVRQDRVSRQAREAKLDDIILYCEWHVKLQPHRNRIHVHGPVQQSGGRVVVGMIDEHLPLP